MAAKRDVAKVVPEHSRLDSGVMRKDLEGRRDAAAARARGALLRVPLRAEEATADRKARAEAPTIPPPTELETTQDADQRGHTSGTFVAAREVMGADLRRDPRSEK